MGKTLNRMYKIVMSLFAFLIELVASYTLGLMVSSFVLSVTMLITRFISIDVLCYMLNCYLVAWLLLAIIPAIFIWIGILRRTADNIKYMKSKR